jgi:hypothetical protein
MKMQSITCYTVTDFTLSRIIMLFEINNLNLIGIPVNIDLLLFGNETLNCDINCSIFLAVQKYICENIGRNHYSINVR